MDQGEPVTTATGPTLTMLRAAKLVAHSGEYICLVRDVSPSETRIQMFHEPPAGDHAFLELTNGEVLPMFRQKQEERQVWYRFARAIDPALVFAEAESKERRELRIRCNRPARLKSGGNGYAATIRDISQNGARLECKEFMAIAQPVLLRVEGLPEMGGWVRWRRGSAYGMVFEDRFRLDELAAHALTLQPVPGTPAPNRPGALRFA